jgi:heterodisulfide reductase subunit B2
VEVSYYPGCSLHGTAAEYDESLRAACEALGVVLTELPDWNCCGASSAHALDDDLAGQLSVRNVLIARREGRELLIPCSECFQRLKHADQTPGVPIFHVNDFFNRPELIKTLKRNVRKPLAGLAGVAYYGCLSQRPPKVTGARAPENPTAMDDLMRALGMEVRPWSYKTDCCGGSLAVTRTDLVRKLSGDLFEAALEAGAECLVTDCPMCQSNLDTRQAQIEAGRGREFGLPVFYITELMALALGDARAARWWKKHFVDPRPLLKRKGLL